MNFQPISFEIRKAMNRPTIIPVGIILLAIMGVSIVFYSTAKYGIGASSDSVIFMSAARSLISGHGFTSYLGDPMVSWPPLYPSLIGTLLIFGIDASSAARVINAIGFGLIVAASGLLFRLNLKSDVLVLLGTISVLLSWPILNASVFALAETLFILLGILYVLSMPKFLLERRTQWLVIAAALVALAWLQRFAGLALVVAGVLSITFLPLKISLKEKIRYILIFGFIASTPTVMWLVRGYLISGTTAGKVASTTSLATNIDTTLQTFRLWLNLTPVPFLMIFLVTVTIVLPSAAWAVTRHGRRNPVDARFYSLITAVFLVSSYLIFLLAAGSIINVGPIGERLLLPILILLLLIVLVGIDQLPYIANRLPYIGKHLDVTLGVNLPPSKGLGFLLIFVGLVANEIILSWILPSISPVEVESRIRLLMLQSLSVGGGTILLANPGSFNYKGVTGFLVISLFAFWLTYQAEIYVDQITLLRQNGAGGYNTAEWRESDTIKWMGDNEIDGQIFSNGPDVLYLHIGTNARFYSELPRSLEQLKLQSSPLQERYLTWFTVPGWRVEHHDFSSKDFTSIFKLDEVFSSRYGSIYQLQLQCAVASQLSSNGVSTAVHDAERQVRLSIIDDVLHVLGEESVILPLGDPVYGISRSTTMPVEGGQAMTFEWSKPIEEFHVDLTSPACYEGSIPTVQLNGSDENAASPDSDYWTAGDGSVDGPVSIGMWVKPTGDQSMPLLSKAGSGVAEWELSLFNGNRPTFNLWDSSVPVAINRRVDSESAISASAWSFLVVTYRGTGGPAASNSINLYVNGDPAPSLPANDAAYVAMENGPSRVTLGTNPSGNSHFSGRIAGGPVGPFFVPRSLTSGEVNSLYQIGKQALDLD
jgi:hypothetical protein